ncbi:MAG: hypothetical protein K6E59_05245 [Bacilli bacterium]|nr:hypothetical protein [Bacilli bacterium]
MNPEAFGMLGILNRAGLLLFGPGLEKGLHKCHLLLLASDASENTSRKLGGTSVKTFLVPSKEELGKPLGYGELSAVGVTSAKAAKALLGKLQKGERT